MLGNKNHDLVCLHFRLNNEKVKSSQNRLSLICFIFFPTDSVEITNEGSSGVQNQNHSFSKKGVLVSWFYLYNCALINNYVECV